MDRRIVLDKMQLQVGQILDLVRYKVIFWILEEKIMPNFVA